MNYVVCFLPFLYENILEINLRINRFVILFINFDRLLQVQINIILSGTNIAVSISVAL